jgi:hypothetical protein
MNQVVAKVFSGEVSSANDVRVVGSPHALRDERVDVMVPSGLTVREILDLVAPTQSKLQRRFSVWVEGEPVPEEYHTRLRLKAGTTMAFRARLSGGGQGGGILRSLLMIALAVFAYAVAGPIAAAIGFAGSTIATSLITTALIVGGSLLINFLVPLPKPKLDKDERQNTYSISGGRNQANPWGSIPFVLGRHRMHPLYAASPYTEIVGDDQFLRMLFVWGMGPIDISDVRIGTTPLSRFHDVEHQQREGRSLNETTTLYPEQTIEEQLSIELKYQEGNYRFTAENIDEIGLDFAAPNGVVAISKKHGNKDYWRVVWRVRYRLEGGPWSNPIQLEFYANKQDTIRKGWSVRVPRSGEKRYEVEVMRMSPKPDNDQTEAYQIQDDVYWTAIRSSRNKDKVYYLKYPAAISALRIKATDQLNGTVDTFNGIVQSYGPKFNGSSWGLGNSQNPADHFRYVLQANSNRRRFADSMLDLPSIEGFWRWCSDNGFTFNHVREQQASVYDTLKDICAAGRGSPCFKDGRWSVYWDDPNAAIVQHFTPRNSWDFRGTRRYKLMPHALRVRFINAARDYQEDEVLVFDDGYNESNADLYEQIEFPGVVHADLAHRHARYHLAQARLRPETYEIQTDFESIVCTRGDRVRLAHDVPLIGIMQGRVADVFDVRVRVDEVILVEPNKRYTIRFRLEDGSSLVRYLTTPPGETNVLTLDQSVVGTVLAGDLFMFGEVGTETSIMRVLDIQPGADVTAKLVLVDDAPGIAIADRAPIPPFNSNITLPQDPSELAPSRIDVTEFLYTTGATVTTGLRISWTVVRTGSTVSYEVQYKDNRSADWIRIAVVTAPVQGTQLLDVPPGLYSFRVRSLFADGGYSNWTQLLDQSIFGAMAPPPTPGGFTIQSLGDISILRWDPSDTINLDHYEIRHSPLLTGVQWGSASLLAANVRGNETQVPTRVGTYLLKAVSRQGVYSTGVAMISTNIATLDAINVVTTFDESSWTGTHDGVDAIGGWLQLGANNPISSWTTLASVKNLYLGPTGTIEAEGIYTFANSLDLGAVYTSRVTVTIDAFGKYLKDVISSWANLASVEFLQATIPSGWDVSVQVRTTLTNPAASPVWSDWNPITAGDITARAMQFRAVLTGDSDVQLTPVIKSLKVVVDMPDRVLALNDTTLAAAGTTFAFTPPFRALEGVAIAIQNRQAGDIETITAKSVNGFTIRITNGGTGVARTIDWVAKGYGRKED